MKLTYIISALKGLSRREYLHFLKFLSSPYFNNNPTFIDFVELIYKYITLNVNVQHEKKIIFKILFPDIEFNDLKLRQAISKFKKLLEEFLVLNQNKKNTAIKNKTLLYVLRTKNLKYNFQQKLNKINSNERIQNNIPIIDSSLEKYFLLKEEYEFDHQYKRNTLDNIKSLVISLEHFNVLENLRLACLDWVNLKSSGNADYFRSKIDSLLKGTTSETFLPNVSLTLFVKLYYLLYDIKNKYSYINVRTYLFSIENELLFEDKNTAYLLLINYCIQKSNKGQLEFTRHALELYKAGIANKVLLDKGILSPFTYKNIIMLLLTLEQFTETKEFMDSFKKFLPAEIGQNSYQFNLALLYFKQKDFENAMKLMANTTFLDGYDDLSARRMLIRIYFENKEWTTLNSLLDSFEIYIRRKKNLGYHKESYIMLIHFTRKVLSTKSKGKVKINKLKEELSKSPNFPEKDWLIYKLNEGEK